MNDILYGIYFLYQWGQGQDQAGKTFDSEFSPKANQSVKTLIGIRVLDPNTIEVYQDFWHFDEGEIADSAQVWTSMPWEIMYSMEKSVTDGKLAFSRSDAVNKNLDWLSLLVPTDADMIKSNLEEFEKNHSVPNALEDRGKNDYFDSRYSSSILWINKHNHAVISNGPFYVDNYLPEARTITIKSFDDQTYPFGKGYWKSFEQIPLPQIGSAKVPKVVSIGEELNVPLSITSNATAYYFLINSEGKVVDKGKVQSNTGNSNIIIPQDKTANLIPGANDLLIFTVSDLAYKPDILKTSFLAVNGNYTPAKTPDVVFGPATASTNYILGIGFGAAVILIVIALRRTRRRVSGEVVQ